METEKENTVIGIDFFGFLWYNNWVKIDRGVA